MKSTKKKELIAVSLKIYKWLCSLKVLASPGKEYENSFEKEKKIKRFHKNQLLSSKDSASLRSGLLIGKVIAAAKAFSEFNEDEVSSKVLLVVRVFSKPNLSDATAVFGNTEQVWTVLFGALSNFSLVSNIKVKENISEILKGNDTVLVQLLNEIHAVHFICQDALSQKMLATEKSIKSSSAIAVSVNEEDVSRIQTIPNLQLEGTKSLGEFLLLSLIQNFGLSIPLDQTASLLGSSSHYLEHILLNGVKGSFHSVIGWVQALCQNIETLIRLITTAYNEDFLGLLRLLRTLISSNDLNVAQAGCQILEVIARVITKTNKSDVLFLWMSRQTLQALIECWDNIASCQNLVCIIISYSLHGKGNLEHFQTFLNVNLREAIPHSSKYIKFLHELLVMLSNSKDEDEDLYNTIFCQLDKHGIPEQLIEIGLAYSQTHCDSATRQVALAFMSDVWQILQWRLEKLSEPITRDILSMFNQAVRGSDEILRLFALSTMFDMLEAFSSEHNAMAPLLYKTLIFLFIEFYGNHDIRHFIICNLLASLKKIPYAPIGILVSPLVKQISLYGFHNLDIDVLFALARHPNLKIERGGINLLELCSRICIHDPIFGQAVKPLFISLVERFAFSNHQSGFMEVLIGFVQTCISALSSGDRKVFKLSKLIIIETLVGIIRLRNREINLIIAPILHQSIILEPLAQLCTDSVTIKHSQYHNDCDDDLTSSKESHSSSSIDGTMNMSSFNEATDQSRDVLSDEFNEEPQRDIPSNNQKDKYVEADLGTEKEDFNFIMDNDIEDQNHRSEVNYEQGGKASLVHQNMPGNLNVARETNIHDNLFEKKSIAMKGKKPWKAFRKPNRHEGSSMNKLEQAFDELDVHKRGILHKLEIFKAVSGESKVAYQLIASCPVSRILLDKSYQDELRRLKTNTPSEVTLQELKDFCMFHAKAAKIKRMHEDYVKIQRAKKRKFRENKNRRDHESYRQRPVDPVVQQSISSARNRYRKRVLQIQEDEERRKIVSRERRKRMRNMFAKRVKTRRSRNEQEVAKKKHSYSDEEEDSRIFLKDKSKTIFHALDDYIKAFAKYSSILKALFKEYTKLVFNNDQAFDEIRKQKEEINLTEWLRFTREYKIVPALLSQVESSSIFNKVVSTQRLVRNLQYKQFQIALALCVDKVERFQCTENVYQSVAAFIAHLSSVVKIKKQNKVPRIKNRCNAEIELSVCEKQGDLPTYRYSVPNFFENKNGISSNSLVVAMEILDEVISGAVGLHILLPIPVTDKNDNEHSCDISDKSEAPVFVPTEPKPFNAGRISDAVAVRAVEKAVTRKENEMREYERSQQRLEKQRKIREAQLRKELKRLRELRKEKRKNEEEEKAKEEKLLLEKAKQKQLREIKRRQECKEKLTAHHEKKKEKEKEEMIAKKEEEKQKRALQKKNILERKRRLKECHSNEEHEDLHELNKANDKQIAKIPLKKVPLRNSISSKSLAEKSVDREIAGAIVKKQREFEIEQKRLNVIRKEKELERRQKLAQEKADRKLRRQKQRETTRRKLVEKKREEEDKKRMQKLYQLDIEAKQKSQTTDNLLKKKRREEEEKKLQMIQKAKRIEKAVLEFEKEKNLEIEQLREAGAKELSSKIEKQASAKSKAGIEKEKANTEVSNKLEKKPMKNDETKEALNEKSDDKKIVSDKTKEALNDETKEALNEKPDDKTILSDETKEALNEKPDDKTILSDETKEALNEKSDDKKTLSGSTPNYEETNVPETREKENAEQERSEYNDKEKSDSTKSVD